MALAGDAESFLPRIRCVFYATFDQEQGPKVTCQVPEGSIITPVPNGAISPQSLGPGSDSRGPRRSSLSSISLGAPLVSQKNEPATSTPPRPSRSKGNSTIGLFEFESIVEYVIPKDQLCGRLVRCNTPSHRIIGFPVKLTGLRYRNERHRHEFRYNLCFVFDRMADLSCYEPIVRKCGRVLLACEQESGLLSSPDYLDHIQPILEQLYEDLNSYSETSIPIDNFNSIELQIFPFYPNPPKVQDWQVPVTLINLEKRKDPSWDLTMAQITPHLNGINHVQRIADLADVDIEVARHCLEHLLFYQCIMMIDIFQYSNMYTLKSNVQWLVEEPSVREECAAYVTRPGHPLLPLTELMHLYSRLKPGKTIHAWIEENSVAERGIDVHRFITFGVIKGFLRRVHRWPFLLSRERTVKKGKEVAFENETVSTSPSSIMTITKNMEETEGTNASGPRSRHTPLPRPMPKQTSFPPIPTAPSKAHSTGIGPAIRQSGPGRPGMSRSASSREPEPADTILERLPALLDGSRHTDELCTMFRVSWPELEKYLTIMREGEQVLANDENLGRDLAGLDRICRVRIIYH